MWIVKIKLILIAGILPLIVKKYSRLFAKQKAWQTLYVVLSVSWIPVFDKEFYTGRVKPNVKSAKDKSTFPMLGKFSLLKI